MQLEREHGSYSRGIVHLRGSFAVNGTSTPDVLRDGKSALIKSVARTSQGLFTVTLNDHGTLPSKLITEAAWASPIGTPVKVVVCGIVAGSYSQSARTFQIQTNVVASTGYSAYTDPVVDDPDDDSRINFHLVGSYSSAGTDAA